MLMPMLPSEFGYDTRGLIRQTKRPTSQQIARLSYTRTRQPIEMIQNLSDEIDNIALVLRIGHKITEGKLIYLSNV